MKNNYKKIILIVSILVVLVVGLIIAAYILKTKNNVINSINQNKNDLILPMEEQDYKTNEIQEITVTYTHTNPVVSENGVFKTETFKIPDSEMPKVIKMLENFTYPDDNNNFNEYLYRPPGTYTVDFNNGVKLVFENDSIQGADELIVCYINDKLYLTKMPMDLKVYFANFANNQVNK